MLISIGDKMRSYLPREVVSTFLEGQALDSHLTHNLTVLLDIAFKIMCALISAGFLEGTLCTTSLVQSYVVHH